MLAVPPKPKKPNPIDPDLFYTKTEQLIRRYKPTIKKTSLTTYMNNLRVLSTHLFHKKTFLPKYFHDFDSVKSFLEERHPLITTRGNFLSSIIVYLKSLPAFPPDILKLYTDWQSELLRQHSSIQSQQLKSDREAENWLTPEEIQDKKKEIQNILATTPENSIKYFDFYQRYLVLSLYTDIPPIRNDFANTKVSATPLNIEKIDCSYNYIDLNSNQLILCNYKTNKTYGVKQLDLPASLCDIIKIWMTKVRGQHCSSSDFLLVNIKDKSKMTTNALTKFINKIFRPKKVSSTMLRKIYLSHKYPVIHTTNEMERDAQFMCHNTSTQQTVYRKK